MLQRLLIISTLTLISFTSSMFSKDLPSGDYVKGKVLEKGKSFVLIKVSDPPFCTGIHKYLVREGIVIPPIGTIVRAQFAKGNYCDDEEPVIEKIEGVKDEKD